MWGLRNTSKRRYTHCAGAAHTGAQKWIRGPEVHTRPSFSLTKVSIYHSHGIVQSSLVRKGQTQLSHKKLHAKRHVCSSVTPALCPLHLCSPQPPPPLPFMCLLQAQHYCPDISNQATSVPCGPTHATCTGLKHRPAHAKGTSLPATAHPKQRAEGEWLSERVRGQHQHH